MENYPNSGIKKKSKLPFIIVGGGIAVAALAAVAIITNVFGLLDKDNGIKSTVTIDGVKQKISSVTLDSGKTVTLKVGGICHFYDGEKGSVPYRWAYYISDESVMGYYQTEYKDETPLNAPPGGDKGYRWFYFKALAPGECAITLRFERFGEPEEYNDEIIYTVTVTE